MKLFKLDDEYSIVCEWKSTRNGFKHEATLLKNGLEDGNTKICYLNRTWERFEYESVLLRIIDKFFKGEENKKYKEIINNLYK